MFERTWFLLINIAENDNIDEAPREVDVLALRCDTLTELATQVSIRKAARRNRFDPN